MAPDSPTNSSENEKTSRRRWLNVRGGFWRMPGAAGIAIALVSVPLILLTREAGILVALVAFGLYPVFDVPRILARPSWWRGALISALGWVLLFIALMGAIESVRPLGEDAMAFLLPFMMYPVALAISGFVRLEGNLRGRPRESGPRIAGTISAVLCALLLIVPLTSTVIPAIKETITGDTPANRAYAGNGEVVSAAPGQVTVRLEVVGTESFRLGPETAFGFQGPGSRTNTSPAGPTWLKPGQKVWLEYVYRERQAQAQNVAIWIDRKGCAGDEKWVAAGQTPTPSSPAIQGLIGSSWEAWVGAHEVPGPHEIRIFEFVDDTRLAYQRLGGIRYTDGLWRQNGGVVLIEINDCYAVYEGRLEGDEIKGEYWDEMGARAGWTARRKASHGSTQ